MAEPLVRATVEKVVRQAADQWELTLLWRFENQGDGDAHFVLCNPLWIEVGREVRLDHSAPLGGRHEQVNTDLGFAFLRVPPGRSEARRLVYSIALPAPETLSVTGRFAYGHIAPDPAWSQKKNWEAVARWQKLIDSEPIEVAFN